MTRIDFYVLQHAEVAARHHFTCRLVEKVVAQGNRVMIATENTAETQALDDLLWSFRPESFVPHQTSTNPVSAPVLISHDSDDPGHHDVLINLRDEIPAQFSRFQRLLEVVVQTPDILQITRNHYTFYKSRGYQLSNHKIA